MTTELVSPGIFAERHTLYYWNTSTLAYEVATVPTGTGGGGGGAVTVADGADVTQGAVADAAWSGTGSGSVVSVLKALWGKLNGTLAVSGTFWQATQPVSLASVPSHPVTNAGTFAVQVTSAPTTAVTGTFWQATQPVSIATMPSTPVTGTFWQATQPVSIATMPTTPVTGTFWQATQPVSIASMPSTPVTNAGTFVVQEEKLNRVPVNMFAEAVAGAASETAITMSYSVNNATVTTGTNYTPTSGKRLRITMLLLSWVSTTTTANTSRLRIRVNASGAATTSSPIQFSARISWESPTFIANEGEFQQIPIPDGLEVPGGGGIMFTHTEAAANGTLDVTALGFEYTP